MFIKEGFLGSVCFVHILFAFVNKVNVLLDFRYYL